jgi:hypothetical protein
MTQYVALALAAGIAFAAAGCTWQQAYSAGQEWQRNACNRLLEQSERERCLGSSSMSYDDYRRGTEATKKGRVD